MTKEDYINIISSNLKMVRTEFSLTQDKMALILGISKKSLVETEKGRRQLSWPEAVTLSTIFSKSSILNIKLGENPPQLAQDLALKNTTLVYPKTLGGKIWWNDLYVKKGFKIQKNIISNHYRILNDKDERIFSSFSYEEIKEYIKILVGEKNE